ncbi:uncharacterized protein si:ch211-156j16.1 [Hoplias malabaricus]|uniref:uncharacterized protein si:ch211-156j16.1 n=1 Tax=Hoplias malabaricus TaxID=27720 RepID=UPI00346273AC
MKFKLLLLLLALAGPFCPITHASTLVTSTTQPDVTTATDFTTANEATEPRTEQDVTATPEKFETHVPNFTETTVENVADTTLALSTASIPETELTTEHTEKASVTDTQPQTTKITRMETTVQEHMVDVAQDGGEEPTKAVEVDDSGLEKGHVVGIVIGALVAVAIIIAVIVVVIRRMGQYSP